MLQVQFGLAGPIIYIMCHKRGHTTTLQIMQLEGIISSKSSTNSSFTTNCSYNCFHLKNIHLIFQSDVQYIQTLTWF